MGKTIGMVLDGFYPSDIRVQKEAKSLIKAGFQVALLCKRKKDEEYFEEVDGMQLMRINSGTSHTAQGIYDILLAINFVHPVFKKKLARFIRKFSINVLHIHDLPLVKTAIICTKNTEVKVVADFHENYPEALSVWFQWKKNPIIRLKNRIFFGYKRWSRYEKWAVNNVDYIIAVVDEMKDRLIKEHNVNQEKIIIVSNTEEKSFIENDINESIYEANKDKFILAYTGGVGPHRGVDTAIEAMSNLKDNENIVLYVTGTISKAAKNEMDELISRYDLTSSVKILGYRPFDQFFSFMKMASVNIIPHHSNGHTDNTIPHKLFQCMMTGKPLIVSSSAPLKRVVNEANSGLVFEAGNSKSMSETILELYHNPAKCKLLGKNGMKATLEGNYNWEKTSEALVSFYKNI